MWRCCKERGVEIVYSCGKVQFFRVMLSRLLYVHGEESPVFNALRMELPVSLVVRKPPEAAV